MSSRLPACHQDSARKTPAPSAPGERQQEEREGRGSANERLSVSGYTGIRAAAALPLLGNLPGMSWIHTTDALSTSRKSRPITASAIM